jgi:hypothetical protein
MAVIVPCFVIITGAMIEEEFHGSGIDSLIKGLLGSEVFIALVALAIIITPFWYFLWHYDVVEAMGIERFANKLFWFTGFIWISFCVGNYGFGMFGGDPITGVWVWFAGIVAAFLFYFLSTLKYRKYATRSGSFKYRWIVLAAVICLSIPLLLWGNDYQKKQAVIRAANRAANEAGVVTAKGAKNKKQEAIAAKYVSGTVLFVNLHSRIKLYEEANESSKVLKELSNKGGEKLISNGEVLFDPVHDWLGLVSVDYNGTKGWIEDRYVSPVKGIATVVADNVEFNPSDTWDANGQPIKHPKIILKKGDTFEVLSKWKEKKKYTRTNGVYKGTLGFVRSREEVITINK